MRERRATLSIGRRPVDGAYLRSVLPIESVWISTFNLRWWSHAEHWSKSEPGSVTTRNRKEVGDNASAH